MSDMNEASGMSTNLPQELRSMANLVENAWINIGHPYPLALPPLLRKAADQLTNNEEN